MYYGLVELQIGHSKNQIPPTLAEMTNILSACPELRILVLQIMSIRTGSEVAYKLVPLNKLEVLDVIGMTSEGLQALLSILAPGPGELSVQIDMLSDVEGMQALQSFFARSNVVRLFLQCSGSSRERIQQHLLPLKNLRVLIFSLGAPENGLEGFIPDDVTISALIDAPNDTESDRCSSLWPKLRTLYFVNAFSTVDIIKRAAQSCRISKLRTMLCDFDISKKEFEEQLHPVVPDVLYEAFSEDFDWDVEWWEHLW